MLFVNLKRIIRIFKMTNPTLALQILTLPDNPGVYQYYDKDGKILYVGKAKNLKKRVSSYFNKIHDTAKTNVLVKKIVTIKHIVVPTETDALLLENNLIKTLQPRYNVQRRLGIFWSLYQFQDRKHHFRTHKRTLSTPDLQL
jgi:excinuclease UvrABC nuclease subunit